MATFSARGKRVVLLTCVVGIALAASGNAVSAQSLSAKLKMEGPASLANAARESGSAVRGAILFPQQKLGCANCHAPGGQDLLGPDLAVLGAEATDLYLAESLLEPSKVIKKGFETVTVATGDGKILAGRILERNADEVTLRESTEKRRLITLSGGDIEQIKPNPLSAMPDDLVDQLEDRQQFLDLLRYLMEVRDAGASGGPGRFTQSPGGAALPEDLRGRVLLDDFQCTACHRSETTRFVVAAKQAPDLAWGAGRIDPHYIQRFVADPLHVKPGTTMPDLLHNVSDETRRTVAEEITHYLVSLSNRQFERQPIDAEAAERGNELFHSVGCVACHSPRTPEGRESLPEDSVPLGRLEQKYNRDGLVAFLENPHSVRPSDRMPKVPLSHWEAVDIASYLLAPGNESEPTSRFSLDRSKAERGRSQFLKWGCRQCHATSDAPAVGEYPSLGELRGDRGCLSGTAGAWPRYDLSDSQRSAIRAGLQEPAHPLTDEQRISVTLATFRCVACHQRGELGGVPAERLDHFQTTNPNLGPQGSIPPSLTGVGAKLKPKWMRQVLVSGRTIRPYMKTRMPQFSPEHVTSLIDLVQQVDQLASKPDVDVSDAKEMRNAGHQLAGSDGLNCVACHSFQQKDGTTMSAVDLTEMAERLQEDWFYHYMRAPQQFNAITVMPSFWPGGKAIRKDILDGDVDRQIAALWVYLLDGRQARTPRGLVREPIELLAGEEAVMLRRSYPGIGKRGIGVGYPGQVNLAFDAEQMRLAMIWKGKFADPAGVWRSQGHGTVRPLGTDLIRFPKGPELDDASNPWMVDEGRPPRHQFRGYSLDHLQRPAFEYTFDGVAVTDYAVDVAVPDSDGVVLRRTLTLSTEQDRPNTVFRVAAGKELVPQDDAYLLDGTLRIRIDSEHPAEIVETSDGRELRIPLNLPAGESKLVLEYVW